MTYRLRIASILIRLRKDIIYLQSMADSCPLNSQERKATDWDIMKLCDLECRLINKLNRLEKEGNK